MSDSTLTAAGLTLLSGIILAASYPHATHLRLEVWAVFPGAAVPLGVCAWGFARTPVPERRKRLARTVIAFVLVMAASIAVAWLPLPLSAGP